MGETAASTEQSLTECRQSVDLLHGRVAVIDSTQQGLVAQVSLISEAVAVGAKAQEDVALQIAALHDKLIATVERLDRSHARSRSPEEDDPDPAAAAVTGKSTLQPVHAFWVGNAPGASASANASGRYSDHSGLPPEGTAGAGGGVLGGPGGGRPGGVGGGGFGGVGGGRPNSNGDASTKHNLKMPFPRFDGDQPRIWKDKCLDYFRLFGVHPSLWLVSATLHMDGNAALWLKAYRLRHEINSWPDLMLAVEEKFGADDHRKFMKQFLALKQRGTVEEYQLQFETLVLPDFITEPTLR